MVQAIDIYRPESELTRTALELKQIADAWKRSTSGARFTEALLTFLASKDNKNTRKAYAFSVLEFFAWYHTVKNRTPLPDEIRRADAFAYAKYLTDRTIGLDEYRLAQDPERTLDLSVYRFIKSNPGARIDRIRKHLLADRRFVTTVTFQAGGRPQRLTVLAIESEQPRGDELAAYVEAHDRQPPNGLDLHLACLVSHNLLRRTPTVEQIRQETAGLDIADASRAQLGFRVDPELFSYFLDTHTGASGAERSGTILLRLTALSSFWNYLIDTGENLGDQEPLLKHNIWHAPSKALRKRLPAHRQVVRELTTPDLSLFVQVLATTFVRSHGPEQALDVANAYLMGARVAEAATGTASAYDLRDRALLCFAFWTGARADEIGSLRRSSLQHTARGTLVSFVGKGGARNLIQLPPVAAHSLAALQQRLDERADRASPTSLAHMLVDDASPLYPPLKLWGRNQRPDLSPGDIRGLTVQGFGVMLHRRAKVAGFEPYGDSWRRMHPHGIRHLAAQQARARGVDLPTIQATLGHRSLATTGIYLEVKDPFERSLAPPVAAAPPPVVVPAAPVELELEPEIEPEVDYDLVAEPEELPEELIAEQPEPLIGVGAPPLELSPHDEAVELAEESEAVQSLLRIYTTNWGEKEHRTKLVAQGAGLLAHTYVGKRSGLAWWQGGGGKLSAPMSYTPNVSFPAMPVISPAQFMGALTTGPCEEPLCQSLAGLYEQWLGDPDKGPTAARALSEWVFSAATVTMDVDEVVRGRAGDWLAFDAPLEDTHLRGSPRILREHLDDAVLAWFERTAWQHRTSAESRMVRGTDLKIPEWYGQADPLASLPPSERAELLDWLQVFVGLPPQDMTPRFDGMSRAEIGKFLSLLCAYETLSTDPDLRKPEKRQYLEPIDVELTKLVAKLTHGRVKDFHYGETKLGRKAETVRAEMAREEAKRAGPDEELRAAVAASYSKYLAPHLMEVVGQVFGKKAATDPILELFALCTAGAPLKDVLDKYKDLFRVRKGTIAHTPAFIKSFALDTGQHSECVARRLARHIYEEGKAPQWHKRRNWPESTIPYLEAMSAYRIPCPSSQEKDLRGLLPTEEPIPVYEQWREAGNRLYAASIPEHETELIGVMAEEVARGGARPTRLQTGHRETRPNRRGRQHENFAAVRQHTPNPLLLIPLIIAMKRALP